LPDVITYTLAQLRGFTEASARDDLDRVAQFAVATRMAMGAEPADWQKYLAALSGQATAQQKQGTTTHG